jgi:hypothetical protein
MGRGDITETNGKYYKVSTPLNDRPQLLMAPKNSTAGNTTTITWQANMLTGANLLYKKASDNIFLTIANTEQLDHGSFSLVNLAPADFEYYLNLTSSLTGATSTSQIYNFSIKSPVANLQTPQTSSTAATITPVKLGATINSKKETEGAQILNSGKDTEAFLLKLKIKKNIAAQNYALKKFSNPLVKGTKVSPVQKTAINNFIVYGTASNFKLSAAKRANILKTYKIQNKKLPTSESDWNKIITQAKK